MNNIELTGNIQTSTPMTLTGAIEARVVIGYTKWGKIEGTLTDQTDLKNALDAKASVNALNLEATSRSNADNVLTQNLNAEVSRAKAREDEIEAKIPDHSTFATKQALDNEKARAQGVESTLTTAINTESTTRANTDTILAQSISELNTSKADKSNTYTKKEVNKLVEESTPGDYAEVKAQVVTNKENISTLNRTKQNKIEDLDAIRAGAAKGATALQSIPTSYKTKSENDKLYQPKGNYASPEDIPTKVSQLANDKGYLTEHQSLAAYSLITETGNKIDLEMDNVNYILRARLLDKKDNVLSVSKGIDLPLESLIINVEYSKVKKAIIITLKDGTVKEVPVSDLISGLVNETQFNQALATKENVIADLATIRSGAALGATSIQEHQDISGKVDKVTGKSLISDTEITRLASVDNYDDTQVRNLINQKQNTLTAGTGIHIESDVISATTKTLSPMKSNWINASTTQAAVTAMFNDGVQAGEGYLGTVKWGDLPGGMGQCECKAFVVSSGIIQFEVTSGDTAPYCWFYNSWSNGPWRGYLPVVDNLTSTSTVSALSANQGKELASKITTIQDDYLKASDKQEILQAIQDLRDAITVPEGYSYLILKGE